MRGGQGAGFLRLAVPMVVSRAGLAGMGIADGVMVARYSPAQLAPLGLSDGTLGRLLDVLVALLIGGIVLAAQAQAGSTPHEAGAVWRRAVRLALVTGLAAAAVGLAGPWWLGWLGEAPKLVAATAPVMAVLGAGMPLALVAVATAVFLEAVGRAPVVAAAVAAANVLNIALNWLLQRPTVSNVIIGARNEEQLKQNLGAVGWNLTKEQVAKLDAASALKPIYPYWHQAGFEDRNPQPVKW